MYVLSYIIDYQWNKYVLRINFTNHKRYPKYKNNFLIFSLYNKLLYI